MQRKVIVLIGFLIVLAGLTLYLNNSFRLAQLADQEMHLRRKIAAAPWISFWVALFLYSVVSLVPGTSGKSIVCGYLFGFWQSLFLVIASLTNAAMITFLLSRYVIRSWVEKKFAGLLGDMNVMLERDGVFYLLTLRMVHVPFSLVNYCSGATRVSAWTFCWTTMAGLLPSTILFVYVGAQLPTLHELVTSGGEVIISPGIVVGLIAIAVFPWFMRYLINLIRPYRSKDGMQPNKDYQRRKDGS